MGKTKAPEPPDDDPATWLPAFAAALRERQARLRAEAELPSLEEQGEFEERLALVRELARRLFGQWEE